MSLIQICILAIVQGLAELLPVSSSAHVIVCEKLMGLDPTKPEMTLLLVMLHTGTMFAVIFYFWGSWKRYLTASNKERCLYLKLIAVATFFTGIIGSILKSIIERLLWDQSQDIEMLFGNLGLISAALATVGLLIIYSGRKEKHSEKRNEISLGKSCCIGAIQGLCLPFRGFSRSGATISTGLILGLDKTKVEEFSFALAVVLTPPIIIREVYRLVNSHSGTPIRWADMSSLFFPGLFGMTASFVAGMLALFFLSSLLERGKWQLFGYYCIFASAIVFLLYAKGF